jgi:phosphate transport system substrate-binding protein
VIVGNTLAKGNDGVSQAVRNKKNSIGYVEYAHAIQTRLSYALIRNQAGTLVKPDASSFQAAAATAAWEKASVLQSAADRHAGPECLSHCRNRFHPHAQDDLAAENAGGLELLHLVARKGAKDAAGLGYVPLPPALVAQVKDYWVKNLKPGT